MSIIEVKNLTKVFNNKIRAVDNLSFNVEEGEIFGFLGPNGAGKTTTIFMLSTLIAPTSYEKATILGFDIKREPNKIRKNIGVVFQEISVDIRLTGRENLIFHAKYYGMKKSEYKKKIDDLLELVELSDRADDLVKTYSGGMKRRLEIARGLLNEPKILFLDEMTLGLDPKARHKIWEYIKKLNEKGITIILTSHYLDEIDYLADRILIIDKGKKLEIDTPKNLKEKLGKDSLKIIGNGDINLAVKELKSLNIIKKISILENNCGLVIGLTIPGREAIPEIIDVLKSINYKIKELDLKAPTLNDVFIHYIGRELKEEYENMSKPKNKKKLIRR